MLLWFSDGLECFFSIFSIVFFFFRRLVYPGNPKTFKKIGFSPSRLFFVK